MKAMNSAFTGLAAASLLAISGCSETGSFGSGGSTGGGGGVGSGGGGGGGGGPTVTTEPRLAYQMVDQSSAFFDIAIAGSAGVAVFVSNEDPFGTNPTSGEQIFAVDLGIGDVVQITDVPNTPSVAFMDFDITDNGSEVVFLSSEDITGGNPNNRTNIFLAQTDGSGIVQVTDFPAGLVLDPEISGDGSLIVFLSDEDLTGGNPMTFRQIFSVERDGSNITQITTGNPGPANLAFADNGTRVVYDSAADPFGSNTDNTREIFVIDLDGTNHMQLSDSAGFSFHPKISDNGATVAFMSDGDVVPGQNTDGSDEVFVAAANGTGVTQVTDSTRNSGVFSNNAPGQLDISGSGVYVGFGSNADLTGDNPTETHTIFWATADGSTIGQYLRDGRVPAGVQSRRAFNVKMTNDGAGVLFDSDANYAFDSSGNGEKLYTHSRQ